MTRPRTMLAALLALAPLLAVPLPASGYVVAQIDCPPHAIHCPLYIGPVPAGNATVTGNVSVTVSNASVAYPPADITATADVVVRIEVIVSAPPDASVDATVTLGLVPGALPKGSATANVTARAGAPQTAEFPLALDPALPTGDYLFLPVTLATADGSAQAHVVLHVVESPPARGFWPTIGALLANPWFVGIGGIAVGGAGAWAMARRTANKVVPPPREP